MNWMDSDAAAALPASVWRSRVMVVLAALIGSAVGFAANEVRHRRSAPAQPAKQSQVLPTIGDRDSLELDIGEALPKGGPGYSFRIEASGEVERKDDLEKRWEKRVVRGHVDPTQARRLIETARAQGFFEMCQSYEMEVEDGQDWSVRLNIGGQTHKVKVLGGEPPAELNALRRDLEHAADPVLWRDRAP